MTNDEWIAFQDRLTEEQRVAVQKAREHYFDDALSSWLTAALTMMGGIEASVAGINHAQGATATKQDLIAEKIDGLGAVLDAARVEFRDGLSAVGERLTGLEATVGEHGQVIARHDKDIASFYQSRQRSMQRHDDTQAQIQEVLTQLAQLAHEVHQLRTSPADDDASQ